MSAQEYRDARETGDTLAQARAIHAAEAASTGSDRAEVAAIYAAAQETAPAKH